MKSIFLAGTFIYLCVQSVQAQTYFTFTPVLGIETSFSKIESDNVLEIKNNSASFSPRFGFLVDFHKNKFSFSSGISLSKSLNASFSTNHSSYSQNTYVLSVPIIISYDTKEYNLFYIKRNEVINGEESGLLKSNFFLMSFKLRPFAGLNVDFVDRISDNTIINKGYLYTETIQYSILNSNGISAIFGLTFQFLQKGKERLALNFYYNQGLTKYLNANYMYTENNVSQTANVISKGTYIAIGISYPIKILDINQRKSTKAANN